MSNNHKIMMEREHLKTLLRMTDLQCRNIICDECDVREHCHILFNGHSTFVNDVLIPCGITTDGSEIEA